MESCNYLTFDTNTEESRAMLLEHGRILYDKEKQALWFNWTGSGFTVRFEGSFLKAKLISLPQMMTAPFEHEDALMHPVIGVHADGGELLRFKLEGGEQEKILFQGESAEHIVAFRKLSENVMGKCALLSLETDGTFLEAPEAKELHFEFVGDSITCGYGIESAEPGLRTEEENAEATYAFLTAKALNAEYSAVCVTGCGVTDPSYCLDLENRGMDSMYEFTDAPMERVQGKEPAVKWDFEKHKSDVVVVNLGTNDMIDLAWQNYDQNVDLRFRKNYRELIEMIRACNGKDTLIVCTLGPMSYYLYDEIRDIVKEYAETKKDKKIVCFKYGEMNMMAEGFGSDGHPSVKTNARMAKELTGFLKDYFC